MALASSSTPIIHPLEASQSNRTLINGNFLTSKFKPHFTIFAQTPFSSILPTKMAFFSTLSIFIITLFCCYTSSISQQPYVGITTTDCTNDHNSSSGLGYFCNGLNKTCQTYLTFRSAPPYNTISTISNLLGADPFQISAINKVSQNQTLESNKLVIVPINCSCSGEFYGTNTSYVVNRGDTYLFIANNTFQGLSTCQALIHQRGNPSPLELNPGQRISVPLRCACPTRNQTALGVNYLVSYVVSATDDDSNISGMFGVNDALLLEANGLSEQDNTIFPFTTLLIPLESPPNPSQIIEPPPPPPTPPPPPQLPPVTSSSKKSSSKAWVYALLGALGGAALVLVLAAIIFYKFFRRGDEKTDLVPASESFEADDKTMKNKIEEESLDFLESISKMAQSLNVYNFQELKVATNGFSQSSLIKGSVYLGRINGDLAAIKKMDGDVSKEINLLQKINHSNLIRLSGFCFNEGHWYLVYEYAANGPLSDWIYNDGEDGKFLNWTQRVQVALDVATGLNYLHSFATSAHVHKDIKSSNILLDSDFRAKIANFGLARSAEAEEDHFSLTNHIVGTIGYMAPEYLENGLVSTKLDVHSFGVLLLEMVTGTEVSVLYEGNVNLRDVLNGVLDGEGEESLRKLVDSSMEESYPLELAGFVVKMIDSCLKKNPLSRPSMDEIVQSLSRIMSISLSWELSNNIAHHHESSSS